MTLPIFLVTRFQAVDANGAPLSGALLYFYTAGTTTPITVYQDAGMATPHASPVVADSTGTFAPIYINDVLIKTVLKTSAGVTVQTVDNIPGLSSLGLQIAGLTAKTTPVDADKFVLSDSADSSAPKGFTWANLKTALFAAPALLTTVFGVKSATGHIFGCTLSNDVGTPNTKLDIAAGSCRDSTDVDFLAVAAIVKSTNTWAVGTGNGALDSGSVANSTWYHVFAIKRGDTGVVDVLFSTSPSSPTLPTSYTLFRRIGSFKTDGSAHILGFLQLGDEFLWVVPVLDVDATNPGTSPVNRTMSVPIGLQVTWLGHGHLFDNTNTAAVAAYIYNSSQTDAVVPAAGGIGQLQAVSGSSGAKAIGASQLRMRTDTSGRIKSNLSFSDADVSLRLATEGWVDTRGRLT